MQYEHFIYARDKARARRIKSILLAVPEVTVTQPIEVRFSASLPLPLKVLSFLGLRRDDDDVVIIVMTPIEHREHVREIVESNGARYDGGGFDFSDLDLPAREAVERITAAPWRSA